MRPLQNALFCPISTSGSNFNPRNIQYIPVVKIFAFLDLDQNWAFFKGLLIKTISSSLQGEVDGRQASRRPPGEGK